MPVYVISNLISTYVLCKLFPERLFLATDYEFLPGQPRGSL